MGEEEFQTDFGPTEFGAWGRQTNYLQSTQES
jgi:hypothetical protein